MVGGVWCVDDNGVNFVFGRCIPILLSWLTYDSEMGYEQ